MTYLDNHATTPVNEEVLEAMLPYFNKIYCNPHALYPCAYRAFDAIEVARQQIAEFVGCKDNEVYFTSGATEANNLVLSSFQHKIIYSDIEHVSVKQRAENQNGLRIPINNIGEMDYDFLERAVKLLVEDEPFLFTLQLANSEIGTIQNWSKVYKILQSYNDFIFLHADATALAARGSINFEKLGLNFMTLSAHKMYGPKGIGALIIKEDYEDYIDPLLLGGSQEHNIRSGTLNVPAIVGFGKACELLNKYTDGYLYLEELSQIFLNELENYCDDWFLNGPYCTSYHNRLAGNLSICFYGIEAKQIINHPSMQNIYVSTGSACSTFSTKPSHVLKAIGRTDEEAASTIRIGFGLQNTKEEAITAAKVIGQTVQALQK